VEIMSVTESLIKDLIGVKTSSTTMSFALYELAKNQDIPQKVREDVKSVLAKYDGQITYEAIRDMKYMDLVLSGKYNGRNFASENNLLLYSRSSSVIHLSYSLLNMDSLILSLLSCLSVFIPFTQLYIHPSSFCSQSFHFFTGKLVPLVVFLFLLLLRVLFLFSSPFR
jgi:hypothetical protein